MIMSIDSNWKQCAFCCCGCCGRAVAVVRLAVCARASVCGVRKLTALHAWARKPCVTRIYMPLRGYWALLAECECLAECDGGGGRKQNERKLVRLLLIHLRIVIYVLHLNATKCKLPNSPNNKCSPTKRTPHTLRCRCAGKSVWNNVFFVFCASIFSRSPVEHGTIIIRDSMDVRLCTVCNENHTNSTQTK